MCSTSCRYRNPHTGGKLLKKKIVSEYLQFLGMIFPFDLFGINKTCWQYDAFSVNLEGSGVKQR